MICKFIDFGTAKIIENVEENTAIGTIYYMAPEILSFLKYDSSVDIWSFAIVLYELLTRNIPFHNFEAKLLYNEIKTLNPQENLNKSYHYGIRYILSRVMRKNPTRRISLNEILSFEFVQEKIKELCESIEGFGKYKVIDEILTIDIELCPYEESLIPDENIKYVEICFKIIENTIRSHIRSHI